MYRQQFYILANLLMLLDGLVCIAAGYLAYSVSLELNMEGLVMSRNGFLVSVLFVMVINNIVMGRFGFYSEKRFPSYSSIIKSLIKATALDMILLSAAATVGGIHPFSRVFVVTYFFSILFSFVIMRIGVHYYLDRRALTAPNTRHILLVGTKDRIMPVAEVLTMQSSWGHQVAGCLNVDGQCAPETLDIPVLGNMNDFERVLRDSQIDEVIFALPSDFCIDLKAYVRKCEEVGVAFRIVPGMCDISHPSLRVESLMGLPTLAAYSGTMSASGLMYKRILDIAAGIFGFLVLMLVYPIVGLAIKLDSPGPVLFKQSRIGLHGRKFYLYKFRSMNSGAESAKAELLVEKETPWPIYKSDHDPRITRVGRFLRKTSLDELPQFINVMKGQMSLVGTRPPTPDEVKVYQDWHRRRISIKPGITGLWQISGRKEITDFAEVVKLDLKYIDHWRFRNDLAILWKTFWVVLARKGAK